MELLFQVVVKFVKCMADSGANSIRFFRWFWNFLKEEKVSSFFTRIFSHFTFFQMESTFSVNTDLLSFNPSHPIPDEEKKIKLNFYFYTSLWCLKRFYKGLKGLHKTF